MKRISLLFCTLILAAVGAFGQQPTASAKPSSADISRIPTIEGSLTGISIP